MQTREARASAIHVALPFRGQWRWLLAVEPADRGQAVYLYRGVFDSERWIPAPIDSEGWAEAAPQVAAWATSAIQGETWTERAPQSETWTERTKQPEVWANKPSN